MTTALQKDIDRLREWFDDYAPPPDAALAFDRVVKSAYLADTRLMQLNQMADDAEVHIQALERKLQSLRCACARNAG